jgi:hypothetical protein
MREPGDDLNADKLVQSWYAKLVAKGIIIDPK